MPEDASNIDKVTKALKIVVMDMKKKVEQFPEDFESLNAELKRQDGEIQAISNMVNKVLELTESAAGLGDIVETAPSLDEEKLKTLEDNFEAIKNRLDQIDTTLIKLETVQQTRPELEAAPSEPMDLERLTQLETKFDDLETKVLAARGKLAELDDTFTTTKERPTADIPSAELKNILSRLDTLDKTISKIEKLKEPSTIDLRPISSRLEVLENTISQLETTRVPSGVDVREIVSRLETLESSISRRPAVSVPAREPAPVQPEIPTAEPPGTISEAVSAPTPHELTMKDKVLTIIEEDVSTNAMKIAMKLQVSTASIMGVLRQLESEGRITLSGDVDSNPDVKLA
ncbi:MAG: hypothetical protein ACE5I5_11415 [Candidatus Heimdallarchaeota archaeon]